MVISETLCKEYNSEVLNAVEIGITFQTTVGAHQGCRLSPTIFNLFLKNTFWETLEGVTISGKTNGTVLMNFCSKDDLEQMGGMEK